MDASQRKRLNALLDMARHGKSPDLGELAVYAVQQLVRIADGLEALAIAAEEKPRPVPAPFSRREAFAIATEQGLVPIPRGTAEETTKKPNQ